MDGGTWEGTMTDMLWDEDGELFKCSPRPALWSPPAIATGRQSMDSLLALKRYAALVTGLGPLQQAASLWTAC